MNMFGFARKSAAANDSLNAQQLLSLSSCLIGLNLDQFSCALALNKLKVTIPKDSVKSFETELYTYRIDRVPNRKREGKPLLIKSEGGDAIFYLDATPETISAVQALRGKLGVFAKQLQPVFAVNDTGQFEITKLNIREFGVNTEAFAILNAILRECSPSLANGIANQGFNGEQIKAIVGQLVPVHAQPSLQGAAEFIPR